MEPEALVALVQSIPVQLQMAREYAILGNYEVALNYFDVVLGSVGKFIRSITSADDRRQWFSLKEQIQSEVKLCKSLQVTLSVFRGPPGGGSGNSGFATAMDAPQPASSTSVRPSASGAAASKRSAGSASLPGGGPPAWAGAAAPPAAPVPGRLSLLRAAPTSGSGAPVPRGRVTAAPVAASQNRIGASVPGSAAAGKPPVPKQPPSFASRPGGKTASAPVAPSAGSSGTGKPKYSALPHLAADADLIAMVEKDMLDLNPNVSFDSIAGLEEAKGLINEAVVLPMLIPDYFQGIRRPWKGVLLFGPPGTGKTLLAKAVATECKITFFNVTASTLTSKWRGESERIVRILFDMARYYAPSVIFIDEVDALAGARGGSGEHEASRRVKTELLVQMDGVSSLVTTKDEATEGAASGTSSDGEEQQPPAPKQVVVLAASNLPWELDDAFRRRLEKRIYIPLPSLSDRELMFGVHMGDVPLADDVDLAILAQRTEGYSGADIGSVCRTAAMMPMRRILEEGRKVHGSNVAAMQKMLADRGVSLSAAKLPVEMSHFMDAITATKPSVGHADAKHYQAWMDEFGSV